MDLKWDDERTRKFVTNVGLITSKGAHGNNIMAAEWTHHVSYAPSLMAVCIGPNKATLENIRETREFGVHLAAFDQNVLSSISGGSTGKEVDKIAVLKELGVKFYNASKIDLLMLEDAVMQAECKLMQEVELGDHTMMVGEVVEIISREKEPLIYRGGKYWNFGDQIEKPEQAVLDRIKELVEKNKK
ncbi:TPA: flavin reductase [archaeon]|nr:flavin reductase [Candidatus Undinarchaeales archaeon SRR5007147.bin71]